MFRSLSTQNVDTISLNMDLMCATQLSNISDTNATAILRESYECTKTLLQEPLTIKKVLTYMI